MTVSGNIGVNDIPFFKKFRLPQKNLFIPVFIQNSFNHSLDTLCNVIVRGVITKEDLVSYTNYIDWEGASNWSYKDHKVGN